jgi:hypothetical protein
MSRSTVTLAVIAPVEQLPKTVSAPDGLLDLVELDAGGDDYVHTISRNDAFFHHLKRLIDSGAPPLPLYLFQDYTVITGEDLRRDFRALRHFLHEIEASPNLIIEATREPYAPTGTIEFTGTPHTIDAQFSHVGNKKIENGWCYWHDAQSVRQLFAYAQPGYRPSAQDDCDGESMQYLIAVLQSHLALLGTAVEKDIAFAFQKLN